MKNKVIQVSADLLVLIIVYTFSTVALARPECDLSAPQKEVITTRYQAESDDSTDPDSGIKNAMGYAIQDCVGSQAINCSAHPIGDCGHRRINRGKTVLTLGWVCHAEAIGQLTVDRSYEDICEGACKKIEVCKKIYTDSGSASELDFKHLKELALYYSCVQ